MVVGAGPGGSLAAHDVARTGARTLLVDRAGFPRDKPCGGGVLVGATAQLPFSLDPVAERVIRRFRVRYRRRSVFAHTFRRPLAYMTQRARLDAYLVERAVEAGAVFEDGRRLVRLRPLAEGVRLSFDDGGELTASAVVAADGANGVCRRSLGLPRLRHAVALEANSAGVPSLWADSVGLELGSMPGGYGWIFPKGDHCNLGVGGWPVAGPGLRRELAAYSRSEGFAPARLEAQRGHQLPLRDPGSPAVQGRVAFVGDAAGLVDPLSGEGISNAFRSARLAATEVDRLLRGAAPDLTHYQRAVEGAIEPELAVARQFQALFHQAPWPYVQALRRSEYLWRAFCRILRGEVSYVGFKQRLGPLRPLFDLAAWQAQRSLQARSGWG